MGVRLLLKLLARMGPGEDADVPAGGGVVTGLQVEHGVAHDGDFVDAARRGRFEATENEMRGGTTLANLVAADDGLDRAGGPAEGREQKVGDLAVEAGVESDFYAATAEPSE